MALTICPECKEKISTNASQCVHCGCQLIKCPECGMMLISGTKKCTECGIVLAEQKKTSIAEEVKQPQTYQPTKPDTLKSLLRDWRQSNIFMIACDIMDWPLNIAFFFFMILTLVVINFKAPFILAIILMVIAFICDIAGEIISESKPFIKSKSLWSYLNRNGYSVNDYGKGALSEDCESMGFFTRIKHELNIETVLDAHYFNAVPGSISQNLLVNMVNTVVSAFSTLFLIIFFGLNITNIWDAGTIFSFSSYEHLWALIIAVVLYIVKKFAVGKIKKDNEEKKKAWLKKEYQQDYKKYLNLLES